MVDLKIRQHLQRDPRLAPVVERVELEESTSTGDIYQDLIRAIVYQQLSGKAAATIHGRFLQLFPDDYPEADRLLSFSVEDLRSVGLSRQKATYIRNVAEHFTSHKLQGFDWSPVPDEEIIDRLVTIKGVGRWTVEMILMFSLERPDVLPVDDLGIQMAMRDLYGLEGKGRPFFRAMQEVAEPWRPYRTYASRYLWRYKDGG